MWRQPVPAVRRRPGLCERRRLRGNSRVLPGESSARNLPAELRNPAIGGAKRRARGAFVPVGVLRDGRGSRERAQPRAVSVCVRAVHVVE